MSDPSQTNPLFALISFWAGSDLGWHQDRVLPSTARAALVPVIKDLLNKHNPWEEIPEKHLAPVDLLLLAAPKNVLQEDLQELFELCFTHPQAPSPSTWGSRISPVEVGPWNGKTKLPWIHAMARLSPANACVDVYAAHGGRLDVFDHKGYGPLAYLAEMPSVWERWFAAAHKQNVNLLDFKEGGSYALAWRQNYELNGTTLSQHQKTISALSEKYLVSSVTDLDIKWSQWLDLLKSSPGQRALLTNLKISGCQEALQTNPAMQVQALECALLSFSLQGERLRWVKSSVRQSVISSVGWLVKFLDAFVVDQQARETFNYVCSIINIGLKTQNLAPVGKGGAQSIADQRAVDYQLGMLEYASQLLRRPEFVDCKQILEWASYDVTSNASREQLYEVLGDKPNLILPLMASKNSLTKLISDKFKEADPSHCRWTALAVSAFIANHLQLTNVPYDIGGKKDFSDPLEESMVEDGL